MYLDRILYPVTALGPGKRIALWVSGCSRHCKNCANPELWNQYKYQRIEPVKLALAISKTINEQITGITITGGEPFDQAEELHELLQMLPANMDILIFSGYRYDELIQNPCHQRLLNDIDVLVDGEYIDEQNDGYSALRGSINQRIVYLNQDIQLEYEAYIREGRKIQNFVYDYKTVSVGIHNRGKELI